LRSQLFGGSLAEGPPVLRQLDGLTQIERQPMSEREQFKLFAALDLANRTPIEV
jgi:hypothetical protein